MGKTWKEEIFEPLNLTLLAASGKFQTENSHTCSFQEQSKYCPLIYFLSKIILRMADLQNSKWRFPHTKSIRSSTKTRKRYDYKRGIFSSDPLRGLIVFVLVEKVQWKGWVSDLHRNQRWNIRCNKRIKFLWTEWTISCLCWPRCF